MFFPHTLWMCKLTLEVVEDTTCTKLCVNNKTNVQYLVCRTVDILLETTVLLCMISKTKMHNHLFSATMNISSLISFTGLYMSDLCTTVNYYIFVVITTTCCTLGTLCSYRTLDMKAIALFVDCMFTWTSSYMLLICAQHKPITLILTLKLIFLSLQLWYSAYCMLS